MVSVEFSRGKFHFLCPINPSKTDSDRTQPVTIPTHQDARRLICVMEILFPHQYPVEPQESRGNFTGY